MKRNLVTVVSVAVLLTVTSCGSKKTTINETASYVTFDTQCLGIGYDGTQTLRVWGKGANKAEAIEAAKKKALNDVIFTGINAGNSECSRRPLIYEVNAKEKYSYYFNPFFSKGGEYNRYVVYDDNNRSHYSEAKGADRQSIGIVVTVKCDELRQRLIDDNIIKP